MKSLAKSSWLIWLSAHFILRTVCPFEFPQSLYISGGETTCLLETWKNASNLEVSREEIRNKKRNFQIKSSH